MNHEILGYYSLSNYSLRTSLFATTEAKHLHGVKYPDLPLHLLGRLAVDISLQGKGVGRFLLQAAINAAKQSSELSASVGLVTQPIDDRARDFYLKSGFQPLGDGTLMFISMKAIASA